MSGHPTTTTTREPAPVAPSTGGRGPGRWLALLVAIVAATSAGWLLLASTGDAEPEAEASATDTDAGAGDQATETVAVSMDEFSYDPGSLELDAGTYVFELRNGGSVPHEWALSPAGDHDAHIAGSGELAPGEQTSLTVELDGGVYEFACHLPGHYEADMHGELRVAGEDGTAPDDPASSDAHALDGEAATGEHADAAGEDHALDDEAAPGDHGDAAGEDHALDDEDAAAGDHGDAAAGDDAAVDHDGTAAGETTKVSMTEFAYEPDNLELEAGTHTFRVVNDGEVPHELALAEAGDHHGHGAATEELAPGESEELTVDLEPGEYTYMCHLDGHLEAGMEATLTVAG